MEKPARPAAPTPSRPGRSTARPRDSSLPRDLGGLTPKPPHPGSRSAGHEPPGPDRAGDSDTCSRHRPVPKMQMPPVSHPIPAAETSQEHTKNWPPAGCPPPPEAESPAAGRSASSAAPPAPAAATRPAAKCSYRPASARTRCRAQTQIPDPNNPPPRKRPARTSRGDHWSG